MYIQYTYYNIIYIYSIIIMVVYGRIWVTITTIQQNVWILIHINNEPLFICIIN